jgi:hypothetical protein
MRTAISKFFLAGSDLCIYISGSWSTQFPACFPVDIMHLFYENVTPYMLRHWMGTFFKDSTLNNQPYTLNNKQWSEIGANMNAIKKSIPTEFGRPHEIYFIITMGIKQKSGLLG